MRIMDFSELFSDRLIILWMHSNRLQLNSDKTEFLWCTTSRRQHCLPAAGPKIVSSFIEPSSSARDLRVFIDSDLSMETHFKRTVSSCFGTLRQLRSIEEGIRRSEHITDALASLLWLRVL